MIFMRAYTPFYTIYDCKENATNIQGQIWKSFNSIMNLPNIFTNYGSHILHYISKNYSLFVYILQKLSMPSLSYCDLLCENTKIYYIKTLFILPLASRENYNFMSSTLETIIYRRYSEKLSIKNVYFK